MEPTGATLRACAVEVARWVVGQGQHGDTGMAWRARPDDDAVDPRLYGGTAGVVAFLLEAADHTGDPAPAEAAVAACDFLAGAAAEVPSWGLYDGVAGIAFVLAEAATRTGEDRFRAAADESVAALRRRLGRPDGWSDVHDVVGGTAGTGLFLLWAAQALDAPWALDLAVDAGRRLVAGALPEGEGLKWAKSGASARLMPNFSHGTAGVAYFLACLAAVEPRFLDPALAGARYLTGVADTAGDGCRIFHHEPGGEDLFYLGWCHGPAGTGRLFHRLWQVTGDDAWFGWLGRTGRSLLDAGAPGRRTDGFWGNRGQCCGDAGVAEYTLALHRLTGDRAYLDLGRAITVDLLERAVHDECGTRWVDAEHRLQPELVQARPGYMQGASGIGAWLLHYAAFLDGGPPPLAFPDALPLATEARR